MAADAALDVVPVRLAANAATAEYTRLRARLAAHESVGGALEPPERLSPRLGALAAAGRVPALGAMGLTRLAPAGQLQFELHRGRMDRALALATRDIDLGLQFRGPVRSLAAAAAAAPVGPVSAPSAPAAAARPVEAASRASEVVGALRAAGRGGPPAAPSSLAVPSAKRGGPPPPRAPVARPPPRAAAAAQTRAPPTLPAPRSPPRGPRRSARPGPAPAGRTAARPAAAAEAPAPSAPAAPAALSLESVRALVTELLQHEVRCVGSFSLLILCSARRARTWQRSRLAAAAAPVVPLSAAADDAREAARSSSTMHERRDSNETRREAVQPPRAQVRALLPGAPLRLRQRRAARWLACLAAPQVVEVAVQATPAKVYRLGAVRYAPGLSVHGGDGRANAREGVCVRAGGRRLPCRALASRPRSRSLCSVLMHAWRRLMLTARAGTMCLRMFVCV